MGFSQIDLSSGTSTTVPSGARWKVSLMIKPANGEIALNGRTIAEPNNTETTSHIRTDLFEGDTVRAKFGDARIRGYRVDA